MEQNRRDFIKFVGRQAQLSSELLALTTLSGCQNLGLKNFSPFPSNKDQVILTEGLTYNTVATWGDSFKQGQYQVGMHCDFNTFLPFNNKTHEGFLWVNHESMDPRHLHATHPLTSSSKEKLAREMQAVGGSLLHIKKIDSHWRMQKNSLLSHQWNGKTTIPFSNSTKILGSSTALGTLANCSGGQTPWGTILTSEENYHLFYGEVEYSKGRRKKIPSKYFKWDQQNHRPPEHYGWVVEINPFTKKATKHISLGRAAHEGATVATTKTRKSVVYMGEDRPGGALFKFVSEDSSLEKGQLYAADTKKGRWIPLDYKNNKKLKAEFASELDVLIYSSHAAKIVGATPLDRPEDIEIDPKTQNIFVSLTNNIQVGNYYGGLLKITENDDFDSLEFTSEMWLSGGSQSAIACPDNLAFDPKGNLWVTTDISKTGSAPYKPYGNNGLFFIPMSGPNLGVPQQMASAPNQAEFTGPWFSPDGNTLFLSVQHPGHKTDSDPAKPYLSQFPNGRGQIPRSAVIAISGPKLQEMAGI